MLLSSGAPLLVVCIARPELLESRPSWPVTLRLEPLGSEDAASLIGAAVPEELRARIAVAAGGNPLFIGEMLAMAGVAGAGVEVPPSLRLLLAARLDQLDTGERRVLERGAVEGEVFHRGAVQALAPEETQVTPRLAALVRRQLIRPDQAQFAREDGFRFRHLLIRDAAYDALPKATRAELHKRFAAWLEQRGEELVELDEILGYHLEQAARYKQELGQADPTLAERAGERLAGAGRRALWRGDNRAAERLLERALELTRPTRLDVVLELDLATALSNRDGAKAAAIAAAAAERARAAGEETGELLARVGAAYHRSSSRLTRPSTSSSNSRARRCRCSSRRKPRRPGARLVRARLRGRELPRPLRGSCARVGAGTPPRPPRRTAQLELSASRTRSPSGRARRTRRSAPSTHSFPRVRIRRPLLTRAWLLTMLTRFEEASQIAGEAGERWRELTGDDEVDGSLGDIAVTAGHHEDAAVHLRRYCDLLEDCGQRSYLSSYAPMLGRSLCALGRHDEAEPLARLGRELGDEQDAITQALWRQVQALVHARRGHHTQAEQLAREAVAISERTDGLNLQGDALCDLAEVLNAAGRSDQALAALAQALERYERKNNLAMAAQARDRLAELQDAAPR